MRAVSGIATDAMEIHSLAGDGTAVKVNAMHNVDPSRRFPSVCYIDGDSLQEESPTAKVFRLPGECPESYIFNTVLDKIDEYIGTLAVAMHRPYEDSNRVRDILMQVKLTNRDPHLLCSQVGKNLGFISEGIVRSAFLSTWTQMYPDEVRRILTPIQSMLPQERGETQQEVVALFN